MPTESIVFIAVFTVAFAAIIFVVAKLMAKVKTQNQRNDAAVEMFAAQRNTPEGKQRVEYAEIAGVKAAALSAVEADEAAGRTPRMTGDRVASHRRGVRREIDALRARLSRSADTKSRGS